MQIKISLTQLIGIIAGVVTPCGIAFAIAFVKLGNRVTHLEASLTARQNHLERIEESLDEVRKDIKIILRR